MEPIAKVLEHGFVKFIGYKSDARQAIALIRAPYVMLSESRPILVSAGIVDRPEISEPFSIWVPPLTKNDIDVEYRHKFEDLSAKITIGTIILAEESIKIYQNIASMVTSLNVCLPILPTGVYVDTLYRFYVDQMPTPLQQLADMPARFGCRELGFALTHVLAFILSDEKAAENYAE